MEFLPLVGIVLLFWLFIIRPASKRQKELRRMQSSLTQGDEVVLTSGVFGTISRVDDDHLLVEIADGVVIKVVPAAIGSKVQPHDGEDRGYPDVEDDRVTDAGQDDTEIEDGKPGTRPEGN